MSNYISSLAIILGFVSLFFTYKNYTFFNKYLIEVSSLVEEIKKENENLKYLIKKPCKFKD